MHFDSFLALVWRLAHGIMAIQAPHARVEPADAIRWAVAAAYHAERHGLDPFELVGIARHETDFRPHLVGPDGKDCGLLQTRVVYSRYSCRELRRDAWLAFAEGARELAENQARCARRAPDDLLRCRLNSYNSGVRYAKKGWAGAYFLRVLCFTEAARAGVKPAGDCRAVKSRAQLVRLLFRSRPSAPGASLASSIAPSEPRFR